MNYRLVAALGLDRAFAARSGGTFQPTLSSIDGSGPGTKLPVSFSPPPSASPRLDRQRTARTSTGRRLHVAATAARAATGASRMYTSGKSIFYQGIALESSHCWRATALRRSPLREAHR